MNSVEIKIFGQSFLINPPKGKEDYYKGIADRLNRLMIEEGKRTELRSDVKVAVKVAFMLAAENSFLKDTAIKSGEILERIEASLKSLDT